MFVFENAEPVIDVMAAGQLICPVSLTQPENAAFPNSVKCEISEIASRFEQPVNAFRAVTLKLFLPCRVYSFFDFR